MKPTKKGIVQNINNWISNPAKKQMKIAVSLSLIGIFLMLIGITDFFKESPFKGKYFVIYILMLSGIGTAIKIYKNYSKNAKKCDMD